MFYFVVHLKSFQCVCFKENLHVASVLSEETLPVFFNLHSCTDYSVADYFRDIRMFFSFSIYDLRRIRLSCVPH